jgi:antitoxin VapB
MNKLVPIPKRAKIFWSGRSQAVRLPKEFRLDAKEVAIHREGDTLVLEPIDPNPKSFEEEWAWLDKLEPFDEDFVAAVNEDPGQPTERPELDEFFK